MTDAVLITGGQSYYAGNTAELYLPSSGLSCSLPSLPDLRSSHSADSTGLLCSGDNPEYNDYTNDVSPSLDTCLQWRPDAGTWEESLYLNVGRGAGVSWTPGTGIGTYLMGDRTSTLIKPDGTQELGFLLKYKIM